MNAFSFAPATRETARARIGLQGPAGCGKTKTALRIAEGLAQGGPIGLVDTERRSALTYAVVPGKPHLGGHEFGHMPMDSYDPRNLIQAVQEAEKARLAVLIIDSWSHFWTGRGGLLEIVNQGSNNTFSNWKKGNPIEQDMLDALLNFTGHLIVTMRTKTHYAIDDSGPKQKITKVGTKVVQREGTEYELGLIIDMVEGTGTVSKTRYEPLEGLTIHHPGEDLGQQVLEQLGQGVDPVEAIIDDLTADGLTYEGALELHAKAKGRGLLGVGHLHPKTGDPSTVGALIEEYGKALKPQPPASPAPSPEPNPAGPAPHSISDAVAAEGAMSPEQSARSGSSPVSAPQMRMMHACFAKVGLGAKDQREERLRATGLIIGRQVATANELTFDEAATLLDTLSAFGERDNPADEFSAMVQGLADQLATA
ncbi:AAA family ATPase [Streptomyces griseus]|uniref:AAA family ATPase n=1 Tax=Streptomyces griseus TaxID=1911 RepID=UPI0013BC278F|nr:AAA family ATPase [Streptomyces griseus]